MDNTRAQSAVPNTKITNPSGIKMDGQSSVAGMMTSVSQKQRDEDKLAGTLQRIFLSEDKPVFVSGDVLDICHLFINNYAEVYIQTHRCVLLIECINILLDRVNTLPQNQMTGLIVSAFILGQSCWQSVVSALTITNKGNRESLLKHFSRYLESTYNEYTAKWFEQYWNHSTDNQIEICRHFKTSGQDVVAAVLTLSLVVQKSNTTDFVKEAQRSILYMKGELRMILDHINKKPAQPQISFNDIRELISQLSSTKNKEIVHKYRVQLEQSFIVQWLDILEAAKTSVNISDVASIQSFLDELKTKYNDLEQLGEDITQNEDERFALILDSISIKPNNKQFALAQYCVGKLYNVTRQIWVVPSGQGKSRISAGIAMIALLCGSYTKVHMVFPNNELMKRDKADFEDLFMFVTEGETEKIQYHVGIGFTPIVNALVILDEVDYFMFNDPLEFKVFVQNSSCIGFTATPANGSVEEKVAAELGFQQFFYSLQDATVVDKSSALMVDINQKAITAQDKAAYIKELAKTTPVLVYCDETLTQAINADKFVPIMVEEGIDHELLRNLDELNASELYPVVVSEKILGMRGFDYRSDRVPITLVLAKSFVNKRDAIQGFNRVGRFTDKCSRVRFTDVEIIDKKAETAQTLAMYKFVASLKKCAVKLQPVLVKKPKTQYRGKNSKREQELLGK